MREAYADLLDPLTDALGDLRTGPQPEWWRLDWWTQERGLMAQNYRYIMAATTHIPVGRHPTRRAQRPRDWSEEEPAPGPVTQQYLEVGILPPAWWLTCETEWRILTAADVGSWSLFTPCPRPQTPVLLVRAHGYYDRPVPLEWVHTDPDALAEEVIAAHQGTWLPWWRDADKAARSV